MLVKPKQKSKISMVIYIVIMVLVFTAGLLGAIFYLKYSKENISVNRQSRSGFSLWQILFSKTLSGDLEGKLVITYDLEKQEVIFSNGTNNLPSNESATVNDPYIASMPAKPGDFIGVGDQTLIIQENIQISSPFAKEALLLRKTESLLAESFTGEIAAVNEFFNCSSGKPGEEPLEARIVTDESTRRRVLELSTDGVDTVCWRRTYDVDLEQSGMYVFSTDYMNITGGKAQIHLDVGEGEANVDILGENIIRTDDDQWHTYQKFFKTEEAHTTAQLYFYAPQTGTPPKPVINRYTDIRLDRLDVISILNIPEDEYVEKEE